MTTLIAWLHARPRLNAVIALAYFALVVLPHNQVGGFVVNTFLRSGLDQFNWTIIALVVAGGLLVMIPLVRNLRHGEGRPWKLFYLLSTLTLMILAYNMLMVLASEMAHYVQYAVMALLLFPLTLRYGETLFWATLLGAIDEGYQYWGLTKGRPNYYDFNDVILNLLGAAFGLVFLRTFDMKLLYPPTRPWHHSPALRTAAALGLASGILLLTGILYIYPPAEGVEARVLLVQTPPEAFWTSFHHYYFHVVRPLEGIVILVLLFLFYRGLRDGRWRLEY